MTSVDSPSVHNAITVRQKLNILEAWQKSQENKLILEQATKNSPLGKKISGGSYSSRNNLDESNEFSKIEEQPLMPVHRSFEALLDAKLSEANVQNDLGSVSTNKQAQKKPFLKKGQGLSRFRMKPENFKVKNYESSHDKKELEKPTRCPAEDKSDSLQAFETLEEQANNSSFCSTSSMVEQLMEDSIKSTPIKKSNDSQNEESCFRVLQEQYARRTQNIGDMLQNSEYYGIKRLDIIDEEPSRLEDSKLNIEASLHSNLDHSTSNECSSDDQSDNETDSKCSCCQDNTQFMSTSVSVYEETTTVYTPIKNTLQNRLKELESEIDAFRSENAHLSKLRSEYEAEYNKFCEEKTQILKKIREEHIAELKELEKEKKTLKSEKIAFEKYIKENKNRHSKEEKEEIRLLKEEIKNLREKMNEKEGRWAAAQARIRTEMKQLKDHNTQLKEEVEKLRKSSKNVSFAPSLKRSKSSTSILRRINGELEKTQKAIADKLQTPPASPDSGLDESRLNENDSHERCSESISAKLIQRTSGDVNDEKGVNESKPLEIYDDYGNREKLYVDGRKEIWYPNGNVKKISADGKVTKTIYYNGDVKEVSTDLKMVKYFYAESRIWHSEYEDGHEIMEFPNGQVEKRYNGQSVEVIYPNGTVYSVTASGDKKWVHLDGTTIVHYASKDEKKIFFPNKQVEIHTPDYKKREYPDGTTKTIYINGMQETKYPNGRIRLKTKDGRLLSDSEVT